MTNNEIVDWLNSVIDQAKFIRNNLVHNTKDFDTKKQIEILNRFVKGIKVD